MDTPNEAETSEKRSRQEDDDDVVEQAPPKKRGRSSTICIYESLYNKSTNIVLERYKPSSPIKVIKLSEFQKRNHFKAYMKNNAALFDILRNSPIYIYSGKGVMRQFISLYNEKILQPQILILNARQFSRDWDPELHVSLCLKLEELNDLPLKWILLICDNVLAHKRAANILKSRCDRFKKSVYVVEKKDINILFTLTQSNMKVSTEEINKLRGSINSHHDIVHMTEVSAMDEVY
jgi:hypothetical protein